MPQSWITLPAGIRASTACASSGATAVPDRQISRTVANAVVVDAGWSSNGLKCAGPAKMAVTRSRSTAATRPAGVKAGSSETQAPASRPISSTNRP
jgi:hypothetical protein